MHAVVPQAIVHHLVLGPQRWVRIIMEISTSQVSPDGWIATERSGTQCCQTSTEYQRYPLDTTHQIHVTLLLWQHFFMATILTCSLVDVNKRSQLVCCHDYIILKSKNSRYNLNITISCHSQQASKPDTNTTEIKMTCSLADITPLKQHCLCTFQHN